MEIKGNGRTVNVNPAEQSNDWLIGAAQEITDAARQRGLELSIVTGVIAVENAIQNELAPEVVKSAAETKESIAEQLDTAHEGYQAVVDLLNIGRKNKIEVATTDTLAIEFEPWLTENKLNYVKTAQEADPGLRFTLVATPNILASPKDIANAVKALSYNTYNTASVGKDLYEKYTAVQLSGTTSDNQKSVQFSLIPSSYTPEMQGTVAEQRANLVKLQAVHPALKVPSVLEAITYWRTLRSRGEILSDGTTPDRTYIRHFDLPEQHHDESMHRFDLPSMCKPPRYVWSSVPSSWMDYNCQPHLSDSSVQHDSFGRLSVK